jgi:PAS domain S-box-containing protein
MRLTWKFLQWHWRSLKTRVTLFTLLIFLISMWSLSFYASRTLREDMERLLGEQQFLSASYLAAELNVELDDRLSALETVAGKVSPAILGTAGGMQAFLEQRAMILQSLFNGGVIIYRPDGTATAELPLSAGRIGVNYMDRDFVAAALKERRSTISRAIIGKKLRDPVFVMTVPIHDTRGKVIGALSGVTNLGKPCFLDHIAKGQFSKAGGYLLVDPQHRQIVSATDKSRIMEVLPAPGINPAIDRFIQGYEGSAVIVNPLGVEVLASDKRVHAAGWIMSAVLPTADAFAPIHAMQRRMLFATILLTVLAGVLTMWMLRRQLSPMLAAAKALAALPHANRPPQPLTITRKDEIGQLIGGFNGLLETLGQRDLALRESESRLRTIIENEPECIKIVDAEGRLVQMNSAGLMMIEADSLEQVAGHPVLELIAPEYHEAYARMHQRVLGGESMQMEFEVLGLKGGRRWLETDAVPMQDNGETVQLAITRDITGRKQEELKRIQAERDLREALRQVEQKELSKSRFLAAASHDLRQPLYAAHLFLDNLASTLQDSQQIASANKVQQALKIISSQLRLFLDLSRMEGAEIQIDKQEISTIVLFEEMADIYAPIARQANVRLLFHPGEFVLYTDGNLLSRLLGNLIGNAIKFSPGGTVLVCARRAQGGHKIQVRDSGQGISDAHQAAIFDDFYQIGNSERNPAAGYGLGLSIVSRIARLLGSRIQLASTVGKGSVFSLVMPP